MAIANKAWNLESFLDSLINELDRARETLAIKAINKPLTYAVKDVSLEMQLFPHFDGNHVQFITAQSGQTGASKIAIQLGSITDLQIRKTTKGPITNQDISIDLIEEIDEDTKSTLRKIGVSSVNDLDEIQKNDVDIEKLSNKKVNYTKLAGMLKKARRGNLPPRLENADLSSGQSGSFITVKGDNLVIDNDYKPVAVLNGKLATIKTANKNLLEIILDQTSAIEDKNELIIVLDPFTFFRVNLNNSEN